MRAARATALIAPDQPLLGRWRLARVGLGIQVDDSDPVRLFGVAVEVWGQDRLGKGVRGLVVTLGVGTKMKVTGKVSISDP